MNTEREAYTIVFAGAPRSLRALLPVPAERATVVPVAITIGKETSIHRAVWRAVSSAASEMHLRLPAETHPGWYAGEVSIGDAPVAASVRIDSVTRLSLSPPESVVQAMPGAQHKFTVRVTNRGNTDIELPSTAAVDLDDDRAQDLALGRSLRAELVVGERRIDRFFEELRDGHGGQALVTVISGGGVLPPGASRDLECTLTLPDTVQPGRSYAGAWELGAASLGFTVVVPQRTATLVRNGAP